MAAAPAAIAPEPAPALRIGVVHNPGSGANRKAPQLLRRVLESHPAVPSRSVDRPEGLAAALGELAGAGVNVLAVSGGDGTIQAVLSVIMTAASPFARLPRLAILRSGTTNMIAGDVGLRGRPDVALARLLERAEQGAENLIEVQRPILSIDAGSGRAPVCGMYFGAAAIVQGVDYCKRKVHRIGLRGETGPGVTLLRFALAMARGQRDIATPVSVGVALDAGARERLDCWILQVTTLERLFLGIRAFWGDAPAPLHYTRVSAQPRHWLLALPALLRGRRTRWLTPANGYASRNVNRVELQLDAAFVVDGEIFTPTPDSPVTITTAGSATFLRWR